jgi:hypothetical protein
MIPASLLLLPVLACSFFFLRVIAAENNNTNPKRIATRCVGVYTASTAPSIAPVVVAISRNMPMRTLVMPSLIYAAAAPDELAIEATSEAPMA